MWGATVDPMRRKFQLERGVGRYIANPAVRALSRAGIDIVMLTELETTGRKTGLARVIPVAASFDDDGAWVISQHGTRSGWGANITADPEVRIRRGKQWRTGHAHFVHDDDVEARARSFSTNPIASVLGAATFAALQTTPVSVRITFTDQSRGPE
ncbi:MAG: nitroreductase family deazaflavin-dependent oxidoreductase [Nocardia sp.]|nr:nitroreductase family deazaflavin-dependent oxidoreductase [Nocardia sp.]